MFWIMKYQDKSIMIWTSTLDRWPSAQDLDPANQPIQPVGMRSKRWKVMPKWVLSPVNMESWHSSFFGIFSNHWSFLGFTTKNSLFPALSLEFRPGRRTTYWYPRIPIQSKKKNPKARLHVNLKIELTQPCLETTKMHQDIWAMEKIIEIQLPTFAAGRAPSQHHRCQVPLHQAFDLVRHGKKWMKADLDNELLLLMLFLIWVFPKIGGKPPNHPF